MAKWKKNPLKKLKKMLMEKMERNKVEKRKITFEKFLLNNFIEKIMTLFLVIVGSIIKEK